MRGWVLYKDSATRVRPEAYEIDRLREVAAEEHIDLEVYSPDDFDLTVTREDSKSVLIRGEECHLPDFLLPRMGAGTTYFALAVIRQLERLGVYSVNSSESIETVKDKLYTHQILARNNLPVPRTMLVRFPVDARLVERQVGFPVVAKTISGSQGSGVFLCESAASFEDLIHMIEATNRSANIIIQEFVQTSHGRDLRVFMVGGSAVACMLRTSRDGQFKANFSKGGHVEPFAMTPEIEWLATQTCRLLNLDIAGVDLLFAGDHFQVCEANSSPGFEGLEQCCGVDIARKIYHFIRIRLGRFD